MDTAWLADHLNMPFIAALESEPYGLDRRTAGRGNIQGKRVIGG